MFYADTLVWCQNSLLPEIVERSESLRDPLVGTTVANIVDSGEEPQNLAQGIVLCVFELLQPVGCRNLFYFSARRCPIPGNAEASSAVVILTVCRRKTVIAFR